MNLRPCAFCGMSVWHDPDRALLAELGGETYQPRCWFDCAERQRASMAFVDPDDRLPGWVFRWWRSGRKLSAERPRHYYGDGRTYTPVLPSCWASGWAMP